MMNVDKKKVATPHAPSAIGPYAQIFTRAICIVTHARTLTTIAFDRYSQAIRSGTTLYVSGCIGLEPKVRASARVCIDTEHTHS